jgi:uncharacterized protein (TIGR02391 family)
MTESTEADMEWVTGKLIDFINLTRPKVTGVASPRASSMGSESSILGLQDVVEKILDRFYPAWRQENAQSKMDRWLQHRVAAQRCLAQIAQRDEIEAKLGEAGPKLRSDDLHPWVWQAAKPQWSAGNHADAVDAAARSVNSRLQQRVGRRDASEVKLVQESFSLDPPKPGQPRIRVGDDDGSATYRSLQEGVLAFGVGCFKAIRNPLAHLSDDEIDITDQEALERLAALSLFARWIDAGAVITFG